MCEMGVYPELNFEPQWSFSSVIIPECPQPAPIDNGVIDAPCWTAGQNCFVTYTCNQEFILVGRAVRRCTDEGAWDAPEPFCASK